MELHKASGRHLFGGIKNSLREIYTPYTHIYTNMADQTHISTDTHTHTLTPRGRKFNQSHIELIDISIIAIIRCKN